MSPVREASLTAVREIRRNLGSTKGLVMFILFFLGGLVPSLVQVLFVRLISTETNQEVPEELKQKFFEVILLKVYEPETAKHLSACPMILCHPAPVLGLFKSTLRFAPLLILLVSFDQLAGEIQHRGIRYVAGRSRRESFVVGKALGTWAVISSAIFVLHFVVWMALLIQGGTPAASIFSWGPRIYLFSIVGAAAWVGLVTLISSMFRTPMVALLVGVVTSFVLWVVDTILEIIPAASAGRWAFPFRYELLLVSHEPLQVLGGVAAFLAWGAVMVGVATIVMKRRDV